MRPGKPNDVLAGLLAELGWRPETLARQVNSFAFRQGLQEVMHIKTGYPWVMQGRVPREPTRSYVLAVLSDRLGRPVPAEELGWHEHRPLVGLPADEGLQKSSDSSTVLPALAELGAETVRRRGFLAISGSGLAASAQVWMSGAHAASAQPPSQLAGEATLDAIDSFVDRLRIYEDTVGGGTAYSPARGELSAVVEMLKNGRHDHAVEQRLFSSAAELARLASWCLYDTGRHGLAQRHALVGLHAARLAGMPQVGANVLRSLALQQITAGDPADAIRLLKSATTGAHSALTLAEQAGMDNAMMRAHAKAGNSRESAAAADAMFEKFAKVQGHHIPSRVYWLEDGEIHAWAGSSAFQLGQHRTAIEHLSYAIQHADQFKRREMAQWSCTLAQAHLTNGDIEQASQAGCFAADQLVMVDSARVKSHLNELRRSLKPRTGNASVREFDEKAQTVLWGT